MVDADWIFDQAEAQHIVENSPDVDLALAALGERDIADSIVEPLTAWRAAQEDPDQLADLVSEDPSGQMGEALVIAHLKRGAYDAALDAVAETLEVCSSAEWLAVLEGLCHQRNGNAEQARAAWSKAAGPIGPLADYLVGNSYSEVKSLERAAKHMHKAVTAWSDEPAWQHSLGDVYAESGKPDTALAHFQNAVSAAAGNHKYQLSLARAYRVSGHRMQAEDAYEIALQNGSPSIEAYREAGENALSLGKHEKALDRFEQAISLAPSDPVIRIGAARATQALGDSRRADVHLRAALELAPEMPEVLLGQGQLLMQAGETQSALRAFESALQAGADTAHVYRYQSRLHLQNGDSDRAMKSLRRALEAEPEDDRLWHDLALAFESQADMTSADEAVCEAIRISPLNPEYRLTLARVSRRVGNLDRAIEELRKGRQSAPSDARLPVETGLVHEDRREYSRALDAYREAIEMDADCLEAYYRAGILLRTLKAYRRAGEMLKHAAELAPINKDVLHQLAAVRALELVHG
jgi:tetratricopeptide (TPR) repeat protein